MIRLTGQTCYAVTTIILLMLVVLYSFKGIDYNAKTRPIGQEVFNQLKMIDSMEANKHDSKMSADLATHGFKVITAPTTFFAEQTQKPKILTTELTTVQQQPDSTTVTPTTKRAFSEELTLEESEPRTCEFPILDPWDSTILKYVDRERKYYNCRHVQPNLTYLDSEGFIRINTTTFNAERELRKNESIVCYWKSVDRAAGKDDGAVALGLPILLNPETPGRFMEHNAAQVFCSHKNTTIYENVYAHPSSRLRADITAPTEQELSVLLFILDSTSLSMFRRNLPKTYDYMVNVMKFHVFKGYNKVGDNTFVNMIPFLLGKRVHDQQDDMKDEIHEDVGKIQFDHWNTIMKQYSNQGYLTSFVEDKPEWGLFHYLAKGFASQNPFDFSFRPFFLTRRRSQMTKNSTAYCFGNEPKYAAHVDIVRRLLKQNKRFKQFIYAFFTELTHDYVGLLSRAEDIFLDFFKEMHEQKYFNNTVIMVMSDHGHRFGALRATAAGLVEERMPIFSIYFPPWFYEKHPNIWKNLKINQLRLSTPFDGYETLRDILAANFSSSQRPGNPRGLSQLYPIPANRTCPNAGIPEHFCTCTQSTPVDSSSPLVKNAAEFMITKLNDLLSPMGNKCAKLSLKSVMRSEQLELNQEVIKGIKNIKEHTKFQSSTHTPVTSDVKVFRVLVEASPSNAQLEASVHYNQASKLFSIPNDISRINMYGNQSSCINDPPLRRYCYCPKQ